MNLQEQYDLVKKAIDNNQLKALFLGVPGYEWGNLKHIPANVATDISAILEHGLYALFENGFNQIPEDFLSTIDDLLAGSPVEVWTAYSIVWSQYWNELTTSASFLIITKDLLNKVKTSIQANKKELINCKELVGLNKKEGLWEDIVISNQSLKKRFGVEIL